MHMDFNVDDFDDAIARLKQMTVQGVVDDAVLEGLRNGARIVQASAKGSCPVKTGQLHNSIVVSDIPDTVGVDVGSDVEYAAYVEYGTGKSGDPSVPHREDWNGMPPQPYLYPALDANRENIANEVKKAVRRVMD